MTSLTPDQSAALLEAVRMSEMVARRYADYESADHLRQVGDRIESGDVHKPRMGVAIMVMMDGAQCMGWAW